MNHLPPIAMLAWISNFYISLYILLSTINYGSPQSLAFAELTVLSPLSLLPAQALMDTESLAPGSVNDPALLM